MRIRLSLPIAVLLAGCASPLPPVDKVDTSALEGTWHVDLRATPDAPAYFKVFSVTSVQGKSFAGSFYDTAFSDGRINADWGAVRFAFATEDPSGTYFHSGVLKNGKIDGLSYSVGRKFVAYWSATRQ